MRVVLGFLISPLVPALVLEALRQTLWPSAAGIAVAFYSYPIALAFGAPAYFAYRHAGMRRLGHYLAGGALGGGLVAFAILWLLERGDPGFSFLAGLGYSALIALLTAAAAGTFWLVAIRNGHAAGKIRSAV
jgi:hypothetical protein